MSSGITFINGWFTYAHGPEYGPTLITWLGKKDPDKKPIVRVDELIKTQDWREIKFFPDDGKAYLIRFAIEVLAAKDLDDP